MKDLDAIILAGGLGTRLRSALPGIPKPLAPVNNKPFLDLLLGQLAASGIIRRVALAVGYKAEAVIARYSGGSTGQDIVFSVEKDLLGTGGALKRALDLTEGGDVLVMNGDSYAELDLAAFRSFHRRRGARFTLALRRVPDSGRYGRVTTGAGGEVLDFAEKSPGGGPGLVNAGVYLVSRGVLARIPDGRKVSLEREVVPGLVGRGVYGFETSGRFIDIGLPETYRAAGKYLKGI